MEIKKGVQRGAKGFIKELRSKRKEEEEGEGGLFAARVLGSFEPNIWPLGFYFFGKVWNR